MSAGWRTHTVATVVQLAAPVCRFENGDNELRNSHRGANHAPLVFVSAR